MCLLHHPKEKEKKRKIKIVSVPASHNIHQSICLESFFLLKKADRLLLVWKALCLF